MFRPQNLIGWVEENWQRVLSYALLAVVVFYLVKGCLPVVTGSSHLPGDVVQRIEKRYIKCLDYFPIHPGERRQPDCGTVNIEVVGQGLIPAHQKADGVSRAICYQVTYDNPSLITSGAALGHEEVWYKRTASKVTVLQNDEWQIFPDQDQQDEQRWLEFSCPGDYIVE